jgi:hypothetical protein
MSIGGNGDDDIEDKLENLTEELSELTRLLELSLRAGAGEDVVDETDQEPRDSWDVGEISASADSLDEYKQLRVGAANSERMVQPWLTKEAYSSEDEKLELYYQSFKNGFDSLQSLKATLSKDNFNSFVGIFAYDYVEVIEAELVELAEPGAQLFGISKVAGNIKFSPTLSPIDLLEYYGQHYYPFSQPWRVLDVGDGDRAERIQGRKPPGEINQSLAVSIKKRRSVTLPNEYNSLLPEDTRD